MRFLRPALVIAALAALLTGVVTGPAPAAQLPDKQAILAQSFRNPVNTGADPSLFFYNGKYHVATTTGDHIGIWSSPSLATLLVAPETVVWRDTNTTRNTQMWAPAFRHVGGR